MSRRRPALDFQPRFLYVDPRAQLAERWDWLGLFGNDQPVELEIGSGKGLFLANAAADNPRHNFLGIEVSRKYAELAAERLVQHGLTNALVIHGEARSIVEHGVGAGSLAAVHVYFPDPWWKQRHRKRRIFDAWLVDQVERMLVPGGELRFASDVADYFAIMRRLVDARPGFEGLEWSADPEHRPLTNFERKYLIQGRVIQHARYRKRG